MVNTYHVRCNTETLCDPLWQNGSSFGKGLLERLKLIREAFEENTRLYAAATLQSFCTIIFILYCRAFE